MVGLEVVEVVEIGGEQFTVYGSLRETTEHGRHDFYDVYLLNRGSGILELVDLGEPFSRRPTREELEELATGLFDAPVVSVERQAS